MNWRMSDGDTTTLQRSAIGVISGAASDTGKVREVNEDVFVTMPGMYVVADGMGGHQAGDVASAITAEVVREAASSVPLTLDEVAELVNLSNSRVRAHALEAGPEGMGTTLVGVALIDSGGDDGLVVFNVGDSRCYQMTQNGELTQLTTDHSLVQDLVDSGEISTDEARLHRDRNVVTRAIGIEESVAADFVVLPRSGDTRLLLCSDGVSGEVAHDELAKMLGSEPDPAVAAAALIAAVVSGPARDNATAVVIDIAWSEASAEGGADDEDVTGPRPSVADVTAPRKGGALPAPSLEASSPMPSLASLIDAVPLSVVPDEVSDDESLVPAPIGEVPE